MKILDKVREQLNDKFRTALPEAFKKKFKLALDTSWDFIGMRLVSKRADGKKYTVRQRTFVETFETGYMAAWDAAVK